MLEDMVKPSGLDMVMGANPMDEGIYGTPADDPSRLIIGPQTEQPFQVPSPVNLSLDYTGWAEPEFRAFSLGAARAGTFISANPHAFGLGLTAGGADLVANICTEKRGLTDARGNLCNQRLHEVCQTGTVRAVEFCIEDQMGRSADLSDPGMALDTLDRCRKVTGKPAGLVFERVCADLRAILSLGAGQKDRAPDFVSLPEAWLASAVSLRAKAGLERRVKINALVDWSDDLSAVRAFGRGADTVSLMLSRRSYRPYGELMDAAGTRAQMVLREMDRQARRLGLESPRKMTPAQVDQLAR